MNLIRTLFSFPSLTVWRVVAMVMLGIAYALAQGASVGLLLPLVQLIQDPGGIQQTGALWVLVDRVLSFVGLPYTMFWLSLAVITMVLAAQLLHFLYLYVALGTVQRLGADMRKRSFRSFLFAGMPFHHRTRAGTLTNAFVEDGNRAVATFVWSQDFLIRLSLVTLYVGLLLLISWQTALVAVGVMVLVTLITQLITRGARQTGESISGLYEVMQTFGTERIQEVRDIKLAGRQDKDADRFGEAADGLAKANFKLHFRTAQIQLLTDPMIVGSGLLIIFVGTSFFGVSLAEIAVFVYAMIRTAPEARGLNAAIYRIAAHVNSLQSVLGLIQTAHRESEMVNGGLPALPATGKQFTALSQEIVFDDVSVAYDGIRHVVSNLTLSLQVGTVTAIAGPSGAGKSTLLAMLVRLLTPTDGRILIDGTPIEQFDIMSLRRGIALVAQDAALFNESILENITFANTKATEDEVIHAVYLANADEFIRALPKGYDTIVGDRGLTLSAGQRQRIALARALLLDPSVLLLDEITSAQDPESERAIQEAILRAKTGRTVIMVTHRLSSIRGVDRVVVIENGRIVEDGAPQDLIRSNGLFRQYYDIQIGTGWEQSPAERP